MNFSNVSLVIVVCVVFRRPSLASLEPSVVPVSPTVDVTVRGAGFVNIPLSCAVAGVASEFPAQYLSYSAVTCRVTLSDAFVVSTGALSVHMGAVYSNSSLPFATSRMFTLLVVIT